MKRLFRASSTPPAQNDRAGHPFGGCNRLLEQYALIGTQLSESGRALSRYRVWVDVEAFRQGVATVPVEVLESYLDDLLDPEVPIERLYIRRSLMDFMGHIVAVIGLFGAILIGLHAVSSGVSLWSALPFTIALSVPFGLLWHFAPRSSLLRRLSYAQVLSHEIARRRGGRGDTAGSMQQIRLDDLMKGSYQPKAQGTARIIVH